MKKGDILELIDNDGLSAPIGSTARVIGVNVSLVNIEWIDKGGSGQMNGEYGSYRFIVITPTHKQKQKLRVPITDVLKIYSVACTSWKSKIATDYLPLIDSEQNITFQQHMVDKMFEAATKEQLPVLEEVFGKQIKDLTLKEMAGEMKLFTETPIKGGAMIEVRGYDEFKNKAFWLDYRFNWELKHDSKNQLCLIPTPKQN